MNDQGTSQWVEQAGKGVGQRLGAQCIEQAGKGGKRKLGRLTH